MKSLCITVYPLSALSAPLFRDPGRSGLIRLHGYHRQTLTVQFLFGAAPFGLVFGFAVWFWWISGEFLVSLGAPPQVWGVVNGNSSSKSFFAVFLDEKKKRLETISQIKKR